MPEVIRSLNDRTYDNKVDEGTTCVVKFTTSRSVKLTGVVLRRLFKTVVGVDFDTPLDVEVETYKRIAGGPWKFQKSLSYKEGFKPTEELRKKVKKAIDDGGFLAGIGEASLRRMPRFVVRKMTGLTDEDLDAIERINSAASLGDAPPSARCDEYGTVPMLDGHRVRCSFPGPGLVLGEAADEYEVRVRVNAYGWYKRIANAAETTGPFTFAATGNDAANALLCGLVYEEC